MSLYLPRKKNVLWNKLGNYFCLIYGRKLWIFQQRKLPAFQKCNQCAFLNHIRILLIRLGLRNFITQLKFACLLPWPCLPLLTKLPFVRSRTTRDPSQTPFTKETRTLSYTAAAPPPNHLSKANWPPMYVQCGRILCERCCPEDLE
jgi:hypothetical protein